MTAPIRAALYLRVSTSRQADNDLSIPDQRRQAKAYCDSHGWQIVADYVEPGASATDDRRPEFQRMIDAAILKPPMFDVILVHSFSRFFRDQFQLEFYVRRLAKNGIGLVDAGLTLAQSTGVISGTPIAIGPDSFTVEVTDSYTPVETATAIVSGRDQENPLLAAIPEDALPR